MGDGLAHAHVLEFGRGGSFLAVHLHEHDAHGVAAQHLQVRQGLQFVGLVLGHVHDEVFAARDHLGHLGLAIGDEADHDLADLRLRARRVLEIVGELFQRDRLARLVIDDLVGAGADRLGVHALRADFLVVLGGMDRERGGQVILGGGERLLADHPHLVLAELLHLLDPLHVLLRHRLVRRIGDEIERVRHRVGVELLAVVEFDALAQVEFQRAVVDLLPALGQLPLVFVGDRDRGTAACPRHWRR